MLNNEVMMGIAEFILGGRSEFTKVMMAVLILCMPAILVNAVWTTKGT